MADAVSQSRIEHSASTNPENVKYYRAVCVRCEQSIPDWYGPIQKYCGACRQSHVYPIRAKVLAIVAKARRDGVLEPASTYQCVDCDRQAQVYDHRSYDAPLDVVPVCRSCNWKRGPAIWKTRAEDRALKAVK